MESGGGVNPPPLIGNEGKQHSRRPWMLITPPPTPNGRLHVGHVAGPFLRADLLRRLIRFVGREEVHHISHIDTYQSYVPRKARERGRVARDFCAEMSQGIREDFASFGIVFDCLADNTDRDYLAFLESAVACMLGAVQPRSKQRRVCGACGTPLFEAYVKGYCRQCFHDCYQNVCENCCHPQSPETLLEPRCCQCGSDQMRGDASAQELWLAMSEADVEAVRCVMAPLVTANRRHEGLFEGIAAHEVALGYATDYGVFPGALSPLALNAWVEIYFAHLWTLLRSLGVDARGGFESARRELRECALQPQVAYCFGLDNSYYYAFLFTWLSLRLDIPAMLPKAVLCNFFLQLNDAKVSSSRNNVIWAKDLRDEAPLEKRRGSLASSCPEFAPRNYQVADLQLPSMPLREQEQVLAQASSRPYRLLRERIERLADPRRFSVEGLLDAVHKWGRYAREKKAQGGADRSTREVDAYLSALAQSLAIG